MNEFTIEYTAVENGAIIKEVYEDDAPFVQVAEERHIQRHLGSILEANIEDALNRTSKLKITINIEEL